MIVFGCSSPQPEVITADKHAQEDTAAAVVWMVKPEWGTFFDAHHTTGTFLLSELNSDTVYVHNLQRAQTEFPPASTFKIFNAMASLQTGVIASDTTVLPWDGIERNFKPWNRDHTLRSAFEHSALWFYQEMARRIGKERMQHWIDTVGYGNRVIGDSIDWFWLDGPLLIRPHEQVDFVKDLVNEALPFDKAVQRQVKDIALVENTPDYRLHAKTGLTRANPDHIGWYVGWVEHANGIHAFALNAQVPGLEARTLRQAITHAVLQHENIIPSP